MPSMLSRPWTRQDERKLLRLRAAGESCRLIALQLKRSEASVVSQYWNKLKRQEETGAVVIGEPRSRSHPQNLLYRRMMAAMKENDRLRAALADLKRKTTALERKLQKGCDLVARQQLAISKLMR